MGTSNAQKMTRALTQRNLRLKLQFCRIDPKVIRDFSDAIAKTSRTRLEKLQKQHAREAKRSASEISDAIIGQYFEDRVALTASMEELAQKLAIVGLFGQVEICIKNMLAIALPNVNRKALFRWGRLCEALGTVGVEIDRLRGYKRVNQLRCLNNAIKHSELVGRELAATGWGKAQDVIDPGKCHRELSEYLESSEQFLKDLRAKLVALIPV
jgi:hypothetical protein